MVVVVDPPAVDHPPSFRQTQEQFSVEQLVTYRLLRIAAHGTDEHQLGQAANHSATMAAWEIACAVVPSPSAEKQESAGDTAVSLAGRSIWLPRG
jgi:hypothetical protein